MFVTRKSYFLKSYFNERYMQPFSQLQFSIFDTHTQKRELAVLLPKYRFIFLSKHTHSPQEDLLSLPLINKEVGEVSDHVGNLIFLKFVCLLYCCSSTIVSIFPATTSPRCAYSTGGMLGPNSRESNCFVKGPETCVFIRHHK